jgi:hypothetical protein
VSLGRLSPSQPPRRAPCKDDVPPHPSSLATSFALLEDRGRKTSGRNGRPIGLDTPSMSDPTRILRTPGTPDARPRSIFPIRACAWGLLNERDVKEFREDARRRCMWPGRRESAHPRRVSRERQKAWCFPGMSSRPGSLNRRLPSRSARWARWSFRGWACCGIRWSPNRCLGTPSSRRERSRPVTNDARRCTGLRPCTSLVLSSGVRPLALMP